MYRPNSLKGSRVTGLENMQTNFRVLFINFCSHFCVHLSFQLIKMCFSKGNNEDGSVEQLFRPSQVFGVSKAEIKQVNR